MDFITDHPEVKHNPCSGRPVAQNGAFYCPQGFNNCGQTGSHSFPEIFCLHGFPLENVSDLGLQLVAKFWRVLCGTMQVKLKFSYHPITNGRRELIRSWKLFFVYLCPPLKTIAQKYDLGQNSHITFITAQLQTLHRLRARKYLKWTLARAKIKIAAVSRDDLMKPKIHAPSNDSPDMVFSTISVPNTKILSP